MMEGESEEAAERIEVFGVHRLLRAPGTKSGYLGVQPNKSKLRPWQACGFTFRVRSGAALPLVP